MSSSISSPTVNSRVPSNSQINKTSKSSSCSKICLKSSKNYGGTSVGVFLQKKLVISKRGFRCNCRSISSDPAPARLRVCADGGANRLFDNMPELCDHRDGDVTLIQKRYKPDVIKGDMDSIRPDVLTFYRDLGTNVVDNSDDQDTTDLHKCISYVRDLVSDDDKLSLCILVAGALGGRFDHEMGNYYLRHEESEFTENESKQVLDAFFLGKAFAEALNERIESTVGEFLSTVGRLQAEQQEQVQEFQDEVLERAKKAKEKAAREALEAQGLVPTSAASNISSPTTTETINVSAAIDEPTVSPSSSSLDSKDQSANNGSTDPLLGISIDD